MTDPRFANRIDVPFTVPFVHRLRFTDDVFGTEQDVLIDVLELSGRGPVKVHFWLDSGVAGARPDLIGQLEALCRRYSRQLVQAGNVELVGGGEAVKNNTRVLEGMLKAFEAAGLDRRSYVVVIGGGAVLDTVGFAAAIAHRGLRLVRLPTTTLSQADSGLGVKNGVNLFGKKNWIGTFAVPWAVINDAALLDTLSDRDYRCGFAEVVKVSLLKDPALFDRFCQASGAIARRDASVSLPMIRAAAHWHLRHITRGGDPFENAMARPLDFGHWSAHKLETLSDFSIRHGEAVAIGVAIDCVYSAKVHGLPRDDARRVLDCLADLGFALGHPVLGDSSLFAGVEEFRQHVGGQLILTMLKNVGEPIDVRAIDYDAMREAITEVQTFAR
jgi:3-dehydroquinate synthase